VSIGTINRDLSILRQQAKDNIRKYIDEKLPHEYQRCLTGLTAILREAWTTAQNSEDKREKLQALSLAKDCYSMKIDLHTNATVVEDAIRFVAPESQKSKKHLKSCSSNNNEDDKESNESGYNDEKSEDKQGEEITVNNIF